MRRVGKSTVLVVEDDPDLRALYRTVLSAAGFAVVALEDGLDALQWAETHTPDAVVLDLSLPRVSGCDVHQEFQAHAATRKIPIVVVTGGDTSRINPDDFACVLEKPITPQALVTAVAECVRRARSE